MAMIPLTDEDRYLLLSLLGRKRRKLQEYRDWLTGRFGESADTRRTDAVSARVERLIGRLSDSLDPERVETTLTRTPRDHSEVSGPTEGATPS